MREQRLDHGNHRGVVFDGLGVFAQPLDALLDALQVGEGQLQRNRLGVADGIDPVLDVDDVVVLEAAHDMGDGGDLADIGEELVSESLALVRALDQTGDVHELDRRLDDLRGPVAFFEELLQGIQPLVRQRDDADVFVNRRERVVGGERPRLRDRVEECGLAHVGQPDDSDSKCHKL